MGNSRLSIDTSATDHPPAVTPSAGLAAIVYAALPALAFAAAISAGAALAPAPAWAVLALLGLGGFIVALARVAPASVVLLAPLLLLRLTEFASGVAIEGGAVMRETGLTGAPSGGYAHRLLLEILFASAAAWPIQRSWQRVAHRFTAIDDDQWRNAARALALALAVLLGLATIVLALIAARHGLPLLDGQDRFGYLARLKGTPYRTIMMNRPVVAPLIGLLLAVPGQRRTGLLLLGWLLLLSILFGEKFTSLVLILGGAAIAPLLAGLAQRRRLPLRLLLAALTLLAALSLPAVLLSYGALDNRGAAWTRLGERAAVQGQLWYLADRAGPPTTFDAPAVRADLASWPRPASQHAERAGPRFGLYYVMARFTPSRLRKQAEHGGTGFVFALHPYLLLAGGVPLLLLGGLAVALGHGVALGLLIEALAKRRWLAALVFARLVNSAYACLFTGYLWNLFGIKSVATAILGLILLALPTMRIIRVKAISVSNPPIRV
ncbi:MAG: DUF6418 domain-containing protein [Sphingomicrobium sp.]